MNKRGQALVGFVLLLPFLLIFFAYVIDNGVLLDAKTKLDEVVKSAITYALENDASEDKVKTYIMKNEPELKEIQVEVGDTVHIKLVKEHPGIFSKIIGIASYTMESNYEGTIDEGEMKIKKIEKE